MTIIIGNDAEPLRTYLEENAIKVAVYRCDAVPSLTALSLQIPDIRHIVIQKEDIIWSMGHILAAAKQLQGKGRLFLLGTDTAPYSMIHAALTKEDLLRLIKTSPKATSTSSGGRVMHRADEPPKETQPKQHTFFPLNIPPAKILLLGIVGSQQRIGCTTQAISLWHYCKALGFDPAIVSSPEQLAAIAAPMQKEEIPDGYRIEGIPFVTNTAHAYDCYLLDVGAGNIQVTQSYADHTILVAGGKPWELQNTAASLRVLRGKEITVLLSFCCEKDARSLQPLFGTITPQVMPWAPELWTPHPGAMVIFDTLLRPIITHILERTEEQEQKQEEIELMKGD